MATDQHSQGVMTLAADVHCPRWSIRAISPASPTDPRALLEIPAHLLNEPHDPAPLRLFVTLGDPQIEALLEALYDHRRSQSETDIDVTFLNHRLHLNPIMQRELASCLAILLIAYHDDCPIHSEPREILQ